MAEELACGAASSVGCVRETSESGCGVSSDVCSLVDMLWDMSLLTVLALGGSCAAKVVQRA